MAGKIFQAIMLTYVIFSGISVPDVLKLCYIKASMASVHLNLKYISFSAFLAVRSSQEIVNKVGFLTY